jgi:hypothetical protein
MGAAHLEAVERRLVVQLEREGYIAAGFQLADPCTWLMAHLGRRRRPRPRRPGA